ncbi:MAG TPA: hypothetical protein VLB87_11145 [Pyrinomonadaceae bacterium]|nr:hypothetical protein [Pyrinomonadaceae bacterium]
MIAKSVLLIVVTLLLASPSLAQFVPSNRLNDAAARLSRDAEDFANATYNNYTNSTRTNRADVETMMLAQQFGAASRIFYRMVVDRRRNQELRDAFEVLQNIARSIERGNTQRNQYWYSVQRSLNDISRELNFDTNPGPFPPDTGGGRGGRMTWRGRVDDNVRIVIRGGTADVETIGGSEYRDSQTSFTASLPPRRVAVRLTNKRGRGEIYIEEQPSRENNFAVVVRIKDPRGGASDYEFELTW